MADEFRSIAPELGSPGVSARGFSWAPLVGRRWEAAVLVLAVAAAGAAVWLTMDAGFLQHPGWLAAQKADFILGPIGVGLYWRHRRPNNRLGTLLIVFGLISVLYIPQASSNPTWYGVGVWAELPISLMTSLVILAFPSGRFDAISQWLIVTLFMPLGALWMVLNVTAPDLAAGSSISGCVSACPGNGLALWSAPTWLPTVADAVGYLIAIVPLATGCVLVRRFIVGTPPRRRAMAIGGPIALLFLLMQTSYRTLFIAAPDGLSPSARPVASVLQWTLAGARSFVWYGFLLALIGAELYAGRVLRQLVGSSLGPPSIRRLEDMLRAPLGDPGLRLGFRRSDTSEWVDADGAPLPAPGTDQRLTEIDRDGRAAIAIIHDQQLVDDPELLRTAGAIALLALENAELDAAWKDSLRAVADSRRRLTWASDKERRKLEQDIHDGAQQRLLAAMLSLSAADELVADRPAVKRQLAATQEELETAIDELRDLARGLYPTVLADLGLAGALQSVALHTPDRITVAATKQRFAPEIEAAFYYCCLEAVQNALKHAGPRAEISIKLFTTDRELRLEVRDTGRGFNPPAAHEGLGIQNMQDRLDALDGHVEISSQPGSGTSVTASAPVSDHP